jgi:glycosyltransferase involved in cell wall biosynthesis
MGTVVQTKGVLSKRQVGSFTMIPEASVIIPTYEEWDILQICLDCLAQQSIAQDRFEVIIANNNATPDVPATVRLPPNARIIHAPKPGSYAARNAAIHESRGKVLFFTDSDCQPDRQWIENGLSSLSRLGPTDRVAGAIDLFPKGASWTGPELYDLVHHMLQPVYVRWGWCATANLVTSRATFDLVGLFDEDSFSGGDWKWGGRASELGSLIQFSQETSIRHPARDSFAILAKKRRRVVGQLHDVEVLSGKKEYSTFGFLLPDFVELATTATDVRLTETEKMTVFWIQYRLRLVSFREFVRLRYLRGKPSRS